MLWQALTLGLGYNATLVTLGAALLGFAAGVTGSFLVLRGRALLGDAIGHATLPGLAAAFLVMAAMGGDGRALGGLMLGAGLSAALGLWVIDRLTARTRLGEDAAIGAVLSVFFGAGVVLLTVVQALPTGRAAGLESMLLGATAGMLREEALLIALGAALVAAAALALGRALLWTAFDAGFARAAGMPVAGLDRAATALALAVTVIGLKVVGLVLIVALLIIPAAAARFWTDRGGRLAALAGGIGAAAGWIGAAISATAPALPTGPIVVLVAAAVFAASLLLAPGRGVVARLRGTGAA